jgi:hypothetical protein
LGKTIRDRAIAQDEIDRDAQECTGEQFRRFGSLDPTMFLGVSMANANPQDFIAPTYFGGVDAAHYGRAVQRGQCQGQRGSLFLEGLVSAIYVQSRRKGRVGTNRAGIK